MNTDKTVLSVFIRVHLWLNSSLLTQGDAIVARARKQSTRGALYSVHPGVAMVQNWIATLPEKTGRTLEQWIAVVLEAGPAETKERRAWLKQEHGFGTNTASWIVERAENTNGTWDDDPET